MIHARNVLNDVYLIDIEVDGVRAFVRIPLFSYPGQYHLIWYNDTTMEFRVAQSKPGDGFRLVSAWGTQPRETNIMYQQQDGAHVQFAADYDFDQDMGYSRDGSGLWSYRGNYGGWPSGYVSAIYLRGECGRKSNAGDGICQINFASIVHEGTQSRPSMSFVTQVKGFSRAGQRDVGVDGVRVILEPTIGNLGVMINAQSIGAYLNSGFELRL